MNEVFHMVPATIRWGTTVMLLLPLLLILIVIGAVGHSMMNGARNSTFELSSEGLRLRGDFYGRTIPTRELRLDGVAKVDINAGPYRPTLRTNGIALPGYRAGWFRLRNGHKGLLYVTDASNVVVVPTTAGYDVLLSVTDPDRFVEHLKALGGAARSASARLPEVSP